MQQFEKRILIITPGFSANEQDSTCLPFLQSLLLKWKYLHPEVELVVMALQYPYHSRSYSWNGIPVIPMNGRNKGGIIRYLNRFRIRRKLSDLHKERSLDGALSIWYGESAWAGHWLKTKKHISHYCWLWGQDARKQNSYPSRLKLEKEEVIALSDSLATIFREEHNREVKKVVAPGMDNIHTRTEKDIDLLAAGSLIPLKQYEIFIEVVAELKRKMPILRTVIAGKGPEENKLRNLIRHYRLEDEIFLAGELSHDELIELMQRSKILLHPSCYEGFSISCMEAIYAGMQVCSFRFPMEQSIPNWYIVKDKTQMMETAHELLKTTPIPLKDPFPLSKTVSELMDLFNG